MARVKDLTKEQRYILMDALHASAKHAQGNKRDYEDIVSWLVSKDIMGSGGLAEDHFHTVESYVESVTCDYGKG